MKKSILKFLVVVGVILMYGVGFGAGKINVALISKGYQHEYWRTVEAGARKAADELNVDVTYIGPESESEVGKQVAMVENAINKKVSIIGLAALDSSALVPVTKKAIKAGIPVVSFDSDVAGNITNSFIATDNVEGGRIAAREMIKRIGTSGKLAIVAHVAGTTTAIDREKGFREEMKKYPNIKILNTQYSNGDKSKALAITQDIVTSNPDIKGIFGTNEGSAFGVAKAIQEKKLQGKVIVIGFDSSDDEVRMLMDNAMAGMVVQNPYMMGYISVQTAVKIVKGEKVEKRIDTGATFVSKENINKPEIQKLVYPMGKK